MPLTFTISPGLYAVSPAMYASKFGVHLRLSKPRSGQRPS
jgi:hypothetical protein